MSANRGRIRFIGPVSVLVVAGIFSLFSLAQQPGGGGGRGRGKAGEVPGPPHDPHDLNGVWNGRGGGRPMEPQFDGPEPSKPGSALTVFSHDLIPLTPDGVARTNANKPGKGGRAVPPVCGNDPIGDGNPYGLVRTLAYGSAFEFIQLDNKVVQTLSSYNHFRAIWMDGRKNPADPDPLWYGYSTGKWDGDTFVVETVGLDNRAWLDDWGNTFSDALKVEERWHRLDQNRLELFLKFDDPKTFQKPWVSERRLYTLQPPARGVQEEMFAVADEKEFNQNIRDVELKGTEKLVCK